MSEQKKITADTIGNVARKYGMDTRTLKEMIKLHPDLYNEAKVYFDIGKIVLPPIIIEGIYRTLGEPD